ncbi:MAG TPA: tyrosine-type recombinase/integrase [Herpetosiphonaceae bacterium]|jgi:site-specific recombinase XerD|nr:tyrosine-type recombinase/integrase [Herpetosiphonaceae bacterium]
MAESWWTPALKEFERHLRAANRRPLTIHGYLRDLDQLRAWMIALGRGDEVPTTADLRAWLAELQEDERAGATLARKRSALRAFFDFAAVERLIPASPVERLERPTHEYELPQTLSREQVAALLRAAEPNMRDYALLHVLLGCGLRVSEVCALTRHQLDLPNRLIYIAGRVVPIPRETLEVLEKWLAIEPGLEIFSIKQRMVRLLCEKYRKLAGIPQQVTPSLLRHTSAVWQLVDGVDPEQLKLQFGHEREDVLVHYINRARQLRENDLRAWQQQSLL